MRLSKIFKAKTYEEAKKKCPKGYRLPERWELMYILDKTAHGKKLINAEKYYRFFWSATVLDDWVACALLDGRYRYSIDEPLDASLGVGRVVYIKEEKLKSTNECQISKKELKEIINKYNEIISKYNPDYKSNRRGK